MNTLGSLRYAVSHKKYTLLWPSFSFFVPYCCFHFMWVLQALCLSVPVHSFSSSSFCHVSSSFCRMSFLTCSHHDPSLPVKCLPFSDMFKIFFGVISSFLCLFLCLFTYSFIYLFVHSVTCFLFFLFSFCLSTCLCDCILLFITLSSKYLFSVLIFSFLVFHSILLKNLISLLYI